MPRVIISNSREMKTSVLILGIIVAAISFTTMHVHQINSIAKEVVTAVRNL